MVLVTHETAFARMIADRIVCMDAGKIKEIGAPHKIIEAPEHHVTKQLLQFPALTFDVISRVDRILKYEAEFHRLFGAGCTFVTTAIEFPDDHLLRILRKRCRTQDLAHLSDLVATTGMRVNPTLIVFSPWIDVKHMEAGEAFLRDAGLTPIIDPVRYQTRLMITKGSLLLEVWALNGVQLIERGYARHRR